MSVIGARKWEDGNKIHSSKRGIDFIGWPLLPPSDIETIAGALETEFREIGGCKKNLERFSLVINIIIVQHEIIELVEQCLTNSYFDCCCLAERLRQFWDICIRMLFSKKFCCFESNLVKLILMWQWVKNF